MLYGTCNTITGENMEIDKNKSFRHNYNQGIPKETLMKYYCIRTEREWDKLIESIQRKTGSTTGVQKEEGGRS
jgi:hypothetical protein